MIYFKARKFQPTDLMDKAIEYLETEPGKNFGKIKLKDADRVSKINSKAMVLISFIRNESGYYQIQVQDKELYPYTEKLLSTVFRMRVTGADKSKRIFTAETDHLGVTLSIIDVLREKYDLSVVIDGGKTL